LTTGLRGERTNTIAEILEASRDYHQVTTSPSPRCEISADSLARFYQTRTQDATRVARSSSAHQRKQPAASLYGATRSTSTANAILLTGCEARFIAFAIFY